MTSTIKSGTKFANIKPNKSNKWFSFFFLGKYSPPNASDAAIKAEIMNDSYSYGILLSLFTLIQLIAAIFAVDCFNQTALRQITRIRIKYFQSLMRQEIGWYDVTGSNSNFAVRATEWVALIGFNLPKIHFDK